MVCAAHLPGSIPSHTVKRRAKLSAPAGTVVTFPAGPHRSVTIARLNRPHAHPLRYDIRSLTWLKQPYASDSTIKRADDG